MDSMIWHFKFKLPNGRSAALLWVALALSHTALAGNLPIFYPSALSAKVREKGVKEELGKVGQDVTVYAKYKDFEEAMTKNPDVVIAPEGFDKQFLDYRPVAQFTKANKTTFKYRFYSMSAKVSEANFLRLKIGLVELQDREKLKEYVSSISGHEFKMIKTVSKSEDLFPLLVFQSADAVLMSPDDYETLKEKFTTKVYSIKESKDVRYPLMFLKKGFDSKELLDAFGKLSNTTAKEMGFTGTIMIESVK